MSTLTEIEAAAAKLPRDEQRSLLEWLSQRVSRPVPTPTSRHSVLDIETVSLGGLIDFGTEDDVLGGMLEDRS